MSVIPDNDVEAHVGPRALLVDDVGLPLGAPESSRGQALRRRVFQPKLALMACDVAILAAAMAITYALMTSSLLDGGSRRFGALSFPTLPIWLGIFAHQRLYNARFIERRIDEVRRILNAVALGVLSVALAGYAVGELLPRSALVVLAVVAFSLVAVEREIARRIFASVRRRGGLSREVVVVGANPEGVELVAMLQVESWLGYRVLGFVDDTATDPQPVAGVPPLGTVTDAGDIVRQHPGSSVIVAASAIESETTNRLLRDLLDQGVHVELSSTLRDIASQRLTVRPLGRFPVVYVEPVQRDGWRRWAKRAFDIVGASIGLILASPLLAASAIAVKLDSRGPVMFRQVRVGKDSTPFQILKLRSMVVNAEDQLGDLLDANEADGPLFKMDNDPRVTAVGRFLRRMSIDEIPQLWKVLKGEMSMVGPRPALQHETEAWDPLLTQRLRVKPGITGMWQVSGRSDASFEDYTRLDLYYVDNWSLLTDLAIVAKTFPVVLSSRGAR
ncbi:hypothetical protein BH10ACT1_BH10ACT1_42740 [soil metagenome]